MEKHIPDYRPGYQIRDQKATYYVTFQVMYWIDIFTRRRYRDIIIDSFRYCQEEKGLRVHAYVIMSNHVHAILSSRGVDLSDIVRDFKTHTSKKIVASIEEPGESRRGWMLALFRFAARKHKRNKAHQFWTHKNHPIELISNHFYDQKLDYIHSNPVEAGIVSKPEDYLYSSARDYCGEKGYVNIDFID